MSQHRSRVMLVALAALACAEATPPPTGGDDTPADIAAISGNNQTGIVGGTLGSPLVVRVTNADGDPLSAVTVNWSVTAGGGSLSAASSSTDADGLAMVSYTLGAGAGANGVRATVASTSLTTNFAHTATAAPVDNTPASIEIVSGDNQSAVVGTQLPAALVVLVRNASSQPLASIAVSWTVTQGGGSLGAANSNTSAQGQASNTYTVGGSPGPQGVMAAVQADATLSVGFGGTANAVGATASVTVDNDFFDPTNAVVAEGGQVTWTWAAGAITHNVTSVSGTFANSGDKDSGTHQVTFSTAGAYDYYCSIHATPTIGAMRGTVTVQ